MTWENLSSRGQTVKNITGIKKLRKKTRLYFSNKLHYKIFNFLHSKTFYGQNYFTFKTLRKPFAVVVQGT